MDNINCKKKKLIKIIKNNIFGFILGLIVMSGISVMAVSYLYKSEEITYKKNDNTGVNVKGALDELYDIALSSNTQIYTCNFGITETFKLKIKPSYITIVADIRGSGTAIELYNFSTGVVKQASGYNTDSWSLPNNFFAHSLTINGDTITIAVTNPSRDNLGHTTLYIY